jgi:hypothetical protein
MGDEAKMRQVSWLCVVPILSSTHKRIYSALFSSSFETCYKEAHLPSSVILS